MMPENNLQRDLQDHADVDGLGDEWGVRREEAIETVLPEEAEIDFERSGGYQGCWTLVVHYDGVVWVAVGRYGSCGGCDRFLGGHNEEETERILREAYAFENMDDARAWFLEKQGDVGWCEYPNEPLTRDDGGATDD